MPARPSGLRLWGAPLMLRQTTVVLSFACCLVAQIGRGQTVKKPPLEGELRAHLERLQAKVDDRTLDVASRERIAMEMAGALDRAAQSSNSAEARREHWERAVEVLDGFRERNPGQSLRRVFEVQGAVYLWASARSRIAPERVSEADEMTRALAVADLKNAMDRLLPAVSSYGNSIEPPAQNARYRLAQILADLAVMGPDDPKEVRARNEEALAALAKPIPEPSLLGYANLLKAQLLGRLDRINEAQLALEASASAHPPPSDRELLDVRLDLLLARRSISEAYKVVDDSKLEGAAKLARRVRVGLADRSVQGAGTTRAEAESQLFADLKALRDAGGREARTWLIAAATAIPLPGPEQSPDAWELLSEGALARGNPDRGGDLALKGAARAADLDQPQRETDLQWKAGAAYFQAGRYTDADRPLTAVAQNPKAGEQRANAAMLSALARGRALATHEPGVSTNSYKNALTYVIEIFPDDPVAAEARWLLGKLELAQGNRPGALRLWKEIPRGASRWLDTLVVTVRLFEEDFGTLQINGDTDAVARRLEEAREFLDARARQAKGDQEANTIRLLRARVELTAGVGKPEIARENVEKVLKSVASDLQRATARGLQIVALALLSRYVEAEQAAIREVSPPPTDPTVLLDILRLLDQAANEADSDLRARRIGLLLSTLVRPLALKSAVYDPSIQAEIRLREVRGVLFSGGEDGARRLISGWNAASLATSPGMLRDLADTYTRLGAYDLAADVQRLRMKRLPGGSLPWLDARYGLALAYYRGGHPKDSLQLIDATAILHPELGGGELKDRYLRLRQRVAAP